MYLLDSKIPLISEKELETLRHIFNSMSINNVLPGIIYILGSIYLCWYLSSAEIRREVRLTHLIDSILVWAGVVLITDKIFLDLTYQQPNLIFWNWPINKENHHTFRMFLLYAYALLPAFLVYEVHLRVLLRVQQRTLRINQSDSTEIGRSRRYLQFPPSPSVQELLTLLDEYYLKVSRRPIIRKHRGLRHQIKRTFQLITFSETGATTKTTSMLRVAEPVFVATASRRGTMAMVLLERTPSILLSDGTTAAAPATMLLRRCKSLESMPNFR